MVSPNFCHNIYAFIGQSMDPWDVPAKQVLEMMQMIWDATNDSDYHITISTAVYHKVCQIPCIKYY